MVADIFALGRLLYQASTGRPAADYPSVPEDLAIWPDREDWLRLNQVLAQACAPCQRDRIPDAECLLSALRMVREGKRPRELPRGFSRRRWLLGGAALGATGLGIWWRPEDRCLAGLFASRAGVLGERVHSS